MCCAIAEPLRGYAVAKGTFLIVAQGALYLTRGNLPMAPLLRHGLIRTDTPRDGLAVYLRSADLHITDEAFALLVGQSTIVADKPTVSA